MKTKHLFQTLSVMLIALLTGSLPTWAWDHEDTFSDDGGENCVFRYNNGTHTYTMEADFFHWNGIKKEIDANDIKGFRTKTKLNNANGTYHWEWHLRVISKTICEDGNKYRKQCKVTGSIYFIMKNGDVEKFCDFEKKSNDDKVYFSNKGTHGQVSCKDVTSGGWMELKFAPLGYYASKIDKVRFRIDQSMYDAGRWWTFEYEKPVLGTYTPLPQPTFEWNDNAQILGQAKDAFNGLDQSGCDNQSYEINYGYTDMNNRYGIGSTWWFTFWSGSVTEKTSTKISAADYLSDSKWAPYTSPVYLTAKAYIRVKDETDNSNWVTWTDNMQDVIVKPYTSPYSLSYEFDQWTKKVIINWKYVTQRAYSYNGKTKGNIDCRTDGEWYILRYNKNDDPEQRVYTILGTLKGNADNLQVVDDKEKDYYTNYIYRVVFLPDILKEKYKDKIQELPYSNLWEEITVNTDLNVPIKLAQDRTNNTGIKLMWEYNVKKTGCEWRIDKHPLGQTTWIPVTTIPVDTKQSNASFLETGGSVCDLYVYRIVTKIENYELYSDTLVCNLPAGSYISEVKATTGTETNDVIVTWKVENADQMHDIYYRILRRPIGSNEWTLLADNIHDKLSEYSYKDTRVMAGSYYEYTVEAYGAQCEEQLVQTDAKTAPGFSQARGTITGHISYGTGTAVSNVKVNLVKSSVDENNDQPQFLSRFIDGEGKGLQWTADESVYAKDLNGNKELTLQMWAMPMKDNKKVFKPLTSLNGVIELGVTTNNGNDYFLYAVDAANPDKTIMTFEELKFEQNDFTHVAATYKSGQWTFYVGNDTLRSQTLKEGNPNWTAFPENSTKPTLAFGGSNHLTEDSYDTPRETFSGFVDDVRLWKRALTQAEIEKNYTRILGGTENGLILYWPMDEGMNVTDYVFDVACQEGIFQQNHPVVGVNARPSAQVPSLLSLFGLTDSEGDYIIRGIPFQQGGTNYKLVPALGIHEFSPNTRTMFISPTSLTANNIDFNDISSFPMTGYVYYAGTNIPAEGLQLYIDGDLVSGNGEIKKTDSNGFYEISVPIGNHYVEAKLEGHKMVAGGRFPTEGLFNFDRRMQYDFADSTLVNFVGRVGGGERNDTLAVGFGASKNNIGMATIMLKLNNESFSFNCQDDHISEAPNRRTWDSDTVSIKSHAWTGNGYDAKYIFIRTDSLTGEFSALLPPLRYITKSVKIDSNPNIDFSSMPEIDLTGIRKSLTDSLKVETESGDSVWFRYSYNTKQVFSHYAKPQLDMAEKNNEKGAFGIQKLEDYEIDYGTSKEKITIDDIWKRQQDGTIKYLLDYPIYQMEDSTQYDLFAYEAYANHDGSKVVTDTIPLNGLVVTITNEMSSDQMVVATVEDPESNYTVGQIYNLKSDQVQLGHNGRATYSWHVGVPNIVSPFTRHLAITFQRNNRTYIGNQLDAIVLGYLIDGNNFVTKGPDHPRFVLRDPPGSKSKTSLKKVVITTKESYDAVDGYGNRKVVANHQFGIETTVGVGIGVMAMSGNKHVGELTTGIHWQWDYLQTHEKLETTTITETFSTSAAYPYVGSAGDVYIGNSTNLLIGSCRDLHLTRKDKDSPFIVALDDAISLSKEIATTFVYSQYEIEKVMIPKWKDMRQTFLTEVASQQVAKDFVNNGNKSVYLTWIKPDDANYGKENFYRYVPPIDSTKITKDERDSVEWCTQQIDQWEDIIRQNEKDKLESMAKRDGNWKNYSIDGGSTYSYTIRDDTNQIWRHKTTWKVGGVIGGGSTIHFKAGASYLMVVNIDTETGGGRIEGGGDNYEEYTEWEYTLCDGNRDTDISIDKYKSKKSGYGPVFSIFGGQTYNPYEGQEVTHYYNPGTPLGNATVQMEQPNMSISVNGQNPSKTITVTDLPAGQETNLTLHCTNMANAHQGKDFSYDLIVLDPTNVNGLQILMDGIPINGRSLYLAHNQTVTKQITIRQTDQSILNYDGVKLRFCSQYQPLNIYDEVTINAHFTPSSSPIELAAEEPILNIETLDRNKGDIVLKLFNFNRMFKNLEKIGLQYCYEGNTQWNTIHTYVTNKKDSLNKSYSMLPETSTIRFTYNMMNDNDFPQGKYHFRAFTTTPYDSQPVTVYSDVVDVVKDNVRPRHLTTPTPTSGILRYGEDISLEFNEDIIPGYVSEKNVIVTAKLNDQPIDHDVSVHLSRRGGDAHTENPIFLNGDFSTSFWLNRQSPGTILQLGVSNNMFSLYFNELDQVELDIAGSKIVSEKTVPTDVWTYFVLSYKSANHTFSMLAQYGTEDVLLFDNHKVDLHSAAAINYLDDNSLYLGPITADIHDLSLFNVYRDVYEAADSKYVAKDNYVYGLANYWPMNEGHGDIITDTRHTHNMVLSSGWTLARTNYMLSKESEEPLEANISRINTSQGDSYAIEMWSILPQSPENDVTIFETGTKDTNRLRLRYNSQDNLVLDYGKNSQVVADLSDIAYLSEHRHMALNVVRGQSASFYLDGQRTAVIAESDVPPMEGPTMKIGKGIDIIDEIRIWKAMLTEDRLLKNMYNTIDTTDIYSRGLVAYYPFEKDGVVNGISTKVGTLENMAPLAFNGLPADTLKVPAQSELMQSPIPVKNAPVESRVIAKPIASERKIVIRLEEGSGIKARDIEGTTVNITVDKIFDTYGNTSEPIRWTAFIQLNTLKWLKDSVNISKKYGDDYTFDVNIENRSGSSEYYTLHNMPTWLTLVDSERNDDISPQKTKTLRFKVNPLVAVGNYDVTIGLQGNNEILEPLRIVMKVRGEMPAWSVNPNAYENTMSIVGQIHINGILMGNNESRLAAFIGDECRGIVAPKLVRGASYVAMSVYGTAQQTINGQPADLDKGQPITFRIWDATTGMTYTNVKIIMPDGTTTNELVFDPTQNYGNFDHPLIFTKSKLVEQPINIKTGWNWMSLGVEPVDTMVSVVFKDLVSWNAQLKDQSTGIAYSRGSYWAGSLKRVHANTMYKLQLTRMANSKELPQPLIINGEQINLAETPVTLHKGWNWIAYTPMTTLPIDEALAGANPKNGDQIKSQTGFAYYSNGMWAGNLEALESGKGYLYLSEDEDEKAFVYPNITVAAARELIGSISQESAFNPVNPTDYPDNMAIVIMLTNGNELVTDAEVAAFIEGECRGTAFADDGLYYLLVAGEGSGQPIEIKACIDGTIRTVNTTLTYTSDGSIGTPWEPFLIDINDLTGINPSQWAMVNGQWYSLQGICLGTKRPKTAGVYFFNGQKVIIK